MGVCEYLSQAAEVLDFLNARRHRIDGQLGAFRHGNVKPSNLLLKAGVVKLSDFGLAVMTGSLSQRHTQAGSTAYAGPEVFAGNVNDRSDQYSLAVSYFQLRTATMPFRDSPAQFRPTTSGRHRTFGPLSPREQPILVPHPGAVPAGPLGLLPRDDGATPPRRLHVTNYPKRKGGRAAAVAPLPKMTRKLVCDSHQYARKPRKGSGRVNSFRSAQHPAVTCYATSKRVRYLSPPRPTTTPRA